MSESTLSMPQIQWRELVMRDEIPEQDDVAVGKTILGDDPPMRNLLLSMMVDKSVNNIVNIATVKRQRCDRLNMPYLLGQMRGIEISESASTKDIDPKDTLDGVESNHNVECPISQAQTM